MASRISATCSLLSPLAATAFAAVSSGGFAISDWLSRLAACSSAMIGADSAMCNSFACAADFIGGSLPCIRAGDLKEDVTEGAATLAVFAAREVAVGKVPGASTPSAPAIAALAISFFGDHKEVVAGALARAAELFATPPLPLAPPKPASNSPNGANRPA